MSGGADPFHKDRFWEYPAPFQKGPPALDEPIGAPTPTYPEINHRGLARVIDPQPTYSRIRVIRLSRQARSRP